MSDKIKLFPGDTMLIMVKDNAVIHFTPNMSLPHSEFVKRTTGQLPEGAWVEPSRSWATKWRASAPNTSSATSFPARIGYRLR